MNLPPHPNGLMAPHGAPYIQTSFPLPPQQPDLSSLDVSQSNPGDSHLNHSTNYPEPSNNVDPFSIPASNVPRNSVQNVNPPSQPFVTNGPIPWDCIWPLLISSMPDRSSHPPSATQNTQATSACPTFPAHPTSGPFQFGGGRPGPAVQDLTAPSAAAAAATSSSPSCPNPIAPHTAPEALLFRPGPADAGPSMANAHGARRSKRARPRRSTRREMPFVRIEDRIEWVSHDVMKMTLWFNWSPNAEAEAHDPWE